MQYRVISAHELDESLLQSWRNIQANADIFSNPYFAPEFFRLVAQVRANARVVVLEDSVGPVGFFPYQRSHLGFGCPIAGPLSDYHGVISATGSEWTVGDLLRAAKLSVFQFDHLVEQPEGNFGQYARESAESPQMDLSGGYEAYVQQRRGATDCVVTTERLARKCARERGELIFTLHDTDPKVLELLYKWKGEQYRRSGTTDVFSRSWTRELLERVVYAQYPGFCGVASSVRLNGRIAAVHVGMRSPKVMHWWFPAYDPEYSQYRLGLVSLLRLAETVASIGVKTLDLGKGDMRYKGQLMTGANTLYEGCVELPSILKVARSIRRGLESQITQGGLMGRAISLPVRALRRWERIRRFQ